jgi:hypothetical protein
VCVAICMWWKDFAILESKSWGKPKRLPTRLCLRVLYLGWRLIGGNKGFGS